MIKSIFSSFSQCSSCWLCLLTIGGSLYYECRCRFCYNRVHYQAHDQSIQWPCAWVGKVDLGWRDLDSQPGLNRPSRLLTRTEKDAATEILERMQSRIQRTSMVLQVAGSASWSELPEFSMLLDQRTSTLVRWHKPVRCAMLSSLSRTLAPGPLPCTVPFKFNPMHTSWNLLLDKNSRVVVSRVSLVSSISFPPSKHPHTLLTDS